MKTTFGDFILDHGQQLGWDLECRLFGFGNQGGVICIGWQGKQGQ
jgi:hypothetical protein